MMVKTRDETTFLMAGQVHVHANHQLLFTCKLLIFLLENFGGFSNLHWDFDGEFSQLHDKRIGGC
jgi:hypothetical protein